MVDVSHHQSFFARHSVSIVFTLLLLLFAFNKFLANDSSAFPVTNQNQLPPPSTSSKSKIINITPISIDPNACLTYNQRYATCKNLKATKSESERKQFFEDHLLFPQGNQKEVALVRIHKKKWREDFWLFICSFIIETAVAGKRDVFFYTLDGHEDSIPFEFRSFVRVHLESELFKLFSESNQKEILRKEMTAKQQPLDPKEKVLVYRGGYHRGDLAAALFMKQVPVYDFVWMVESDIRLVAPSWGAFFDDSRKTAREEADALATNSDISQKNEKASLGKDSDLIFYAAKVFSYGYNVAERNRAVWSFPDPVTLHAKLQEIQRDAYLNKPVPENPEVEISNFNPVSDRNLFHGEEFKTFLEKKTWTTAFAPMFGMSRRLSVEIYKNAEKGHGWGNQEIDMPVTAMMNNFKMFTMAPYWKTKYASQFYFGWQRKVALVKGFKESKDGETAPVYATWSRLGGGYSEENESLKNDESRSVITTAEVDYQGIGLEEFVGRKCLRNAYFHPVKY